MEVGSKVYVWRHGKPGISTISGEEIIGEVVNIMANNYVMIHSIIDDQMYVDTPDNVFEVGTGPVTELKYQVVYEDNYV